MFVRYMIAIIVLRCYNIFVFGLNRETEFKCDVQSIFLILEHEINVDEIDPSNVITFCNVEKICLDICKR